MFALVGKKMSLLLYMTDSKEFFAHCSRQKHRTDDVLHGENVAVNSVIPVGYPTPDHFCNTSLWCDVAKVFGPRPALLGTEKG